MRHVSLEVLDGVRDGTLCAKTAIEEATKEILEQLMVNVRYNQSKAAKKLDITRMTLRSHLTKYFGKKYVGTREDR